MAVFITTRPDGSAHASVVNAGVIDDPVTGEPVVGVVVRGEARKITNLRARPYATIVFRAGWDWVAVEGETALAGPNDPFPRLDGPDVLLLIRTIYAAAVGGTPEQWSGLDATIESERHTAVLVRPTRIYPNPAP